MQDHLCCSFQLLCHAKKQWGILFKYRALTMFTMHAPPVLNFNIAKVQQCCTSILVLPHSSKCVLAQDEISPIACPRVCDHNRHTTWGAVVRICAPNLLAVASNFSVSRVMFHSLHKGPQLHSPLQISLSQLCLFCSFQLSFILILPFWELEHSDNVHAN